MLGPGGAADRAGCGSGRELWSAPFLLDRAYLREDAQLAYAVTFHAAEGQTVDSGIAVFTGEEDRQAVTWR